MMVLDLSKIEAGQLVLELSDYCIQDIAQTVRSTLEPLAADKKLADFAGIGELNRVADEIDEDLRQAPAVAVAWWQLGGDVDSGGPQ